MDQERSLCTTKDNPTKSLLAALYEKYDDASEELNQGFFEIYVPVKAPGKTASGGLQLPSSLGLESYSISCVGDITEVSTLCANVKELNLSDNCFSDWEQVYTVLDSVPTLELINLTRNPLPPLTSAQPNKTYPNLKKLILNFTDVSWDTVGHLLAVMTNLEELYLSGNSYDSVTLDIPAYESLRLLQLTSNKLCDWKHVLRLDKLFPKLKNLILAHNNISSCGSVEENSTVFTDLSVLNMNNTVISEWNELDKLSAIKSVSDVRLASIPLVKGISDRKKLMQLLSVHFPRLRLVNGTPVVSDEIETAERVYLRHFEDSSEKPNKFEELEARHGKLERLAEVDMTPAFSVSLIVECEDRQQTLDIPTKQTIGQLKKSLRPFVGCSNFQLLIDRNLGPRPCPLPSSSNNRFVYSFRLRDGEKLICLKPVKY